VSKTVPPHYFIEQYKRVSDPWQYQTSPYERRKYQATLDALARARYRNALELGCSIGVFTSMLAERCDNVLAIDVSAEALARARRNCAKHAHVRFEQRTFPHEYPEGLFDLTTVCEVGYYLDMPDLLELREKVVRHSTSGAHVILVHWTPHVEGHATPTDAVHETFGASPDLSYLRGFSRETYRLDLFERR
jgi:SAM-dependent methyltransferase